MVLDELVSDCTLCISLRIGAQLVNNCVNLLREWRKKWRIFIGVPHNLSLFPSTGIANWWTENKRSGPLYCVKPSAKVSMWRTWGYFWDVSRSVATVKFNQWSLLEGRKLYDTRITECVLKGERDRRMMTLDGTLVFEMGVMKCVTWCLCRCRQ
jgi:hypothetical protein